MSETISEGDKLVRSRTTRRASPGKEEFQFPQFEMPKMEVPEGVRDAATNWINQAKKTFEEVNSTFERAYSTAAKGAVDCGTKVTDITRINTVVAFELVRDLMAAKSLPEVIEISATGAGKQFDVLAAQNHELWALTKQLVNETIKPIAAGLPKAFSPSVST
jgi:hypothetical protein